MPNRRRWLVLLQRVARRHALRGTPAAALLAIVTLPAGVDAQGFDVTLRGSAGAHCFAQALGAEPFTEGKNGPPAFDPTGTVDVEGDTTIPCSRQGFPGITASSDATSHYSGRITGAGTDVFGHTLASKIQITLTGDANANATANPDTPEGGVGSNALSSAEVVAGFQVLPGTPITVEVSQGGTFDSVTLRGGGALPVSLAGGFSGVASESSGSIEVGFIGGAGARTNPPAPPTFNGNVTATVTFGNKPPQGACCEQGGCSDQTLQAECTGTFLGDQTICAPGSCGGGTPTPTPTATPPPTTTFRWTNPSGGAYADVGNWFPGEEPGSVPGRNDTALFELPGTYDVAVIGARASRFVVRNAFVDLVGGSAQVTGSSLAAPSLTVGNGGLFTVVSGTFTSVDVGIGEDAAGFSSAQVFGAGAVWTATGRFTVGHANEAFFNIAGGRLTSAESRIGGGPANGDAVVEGDLSRWDTGNLGLGFGDAVGTLEVGGGGRVVSDDAVIGAEPGSSESRVTVTGVGGQASSWKVSELEVGAGAPGLLEVLAGGRLDFDALELGNGLGAPGTARIAGSTTKAIGTAASGVNVGRLESGELVVEDGARMDAQTVFVGGGATGTAEVRGINAGTATELNVDTELAIGVSASGTLRLSDRAKVAVNGDINVGNPGPGRAGTIEVNSGGELSGSSLSVFQGGIVIDGTAAVTGSPSLLLTFGDFTLSDLTTLEVRNGGELNSVVNVKLDGVAEVAGVTPLGRRSTIALPFGTVVVGDTTTSFFRIRDGGFVDSINGVIDQGSDVFVFGNPTPGAVDWKIDNDFTIRFGALQFCPGPGLVTVGRSITLEANSEVRGNGTLRGPVVVNAGTASPSCSIGTLVIDGAYEQTAQGRLVIEAAGPGDVDVLQVTGATTLDGTLELRFVDGYLPKSGDFLPFLDVAGAVTGDFQRVVVRGVDEELVLAPGVVSGVAGMTVRTDANACTPVGGACERCDNCIDDDGDGDIDRADADCAAAADGAGAGSGGDAAARKALGKCDATLAKVGAKLSAQVAKRLRSCVGAVLACVHTKPSDAACLAKAKTTCGKATAPLGSEGDDRRKARLLLAKACGSQAPGAAPIVPLATVTGATGLGFGAEVARCAALATPELASVDDVIACVDRATVCRAAALFATRVPRAAELLTEGGAEPALLACLPANPDGGTLGDPKTDAKTIGKPLLKCQQAIAAAGDKLATRVAKGYAACAAAMRTCAQSSDPTACLGKAAASCAKSTRGLPTATGAADAKLLAAITKACGGLDVAALRSEDGLGFATVDARCAELGVPAVDGAPALAACLTREHACRAVTLAEAATPRLREYLQRGGVAIE